ncbi:MAG: hypothetical protein ACRDNK_19980 [Solirubrobacteraceae bacterium]
MLVTVYLGVDRYRQPASLQNALSFALSYTTKVDGLVFLLTETYPALGADREAQLQAGTVVALTRSSPLTPEPRHWGAAWPVDLWPLKRRVSGPYKRLGDGI